MIASMLLNVLFLAALLLLWDKPEMANSGWFARLSAIPGLHMALALASACASYLNLALLWHALKRDGIYQAQAGWARHLIRLALACLAMSAVLWLGLEHWSDWVSVSASSRALRLTALVAAGGGSFIATLFAAGFRLRDLRAP